MPVAVFAPERLIADPGRITKWLKEEGETVEKGEVICILETGEVHTSIAAPASGVLVNVLERLPSPVSNESPLACIAAVGEALPCHIAGAQAGKPWTSPVGGGNGTDPSAVQNASVSPRQAGSAGGTAPPRQDSIGTGQTAEKKDVGGDEPENETVERKTKLGLRVAQAVPLSETRRVIGTRLTSSLQSTAQVTLMFEADASELVSLRGRRLQELETRTGARLTYTDVLVKVVARALKEFPIMNSTLEEDGIKLIAEVNVGVAVATERGLAVPVIRGADTADLAAVAAVTKDLAARAREGKLKLNEVTGGTFTITNLGMTKVDFFTPIINPPQSGILGVGRIIKKPVVTTDDKVEVRPMVSLSLTFDHRVMDGYKAAEFLKMLVDILEDRSRLDEVAR